MSYCNNLFQSNLNLEIRRYPQKSNLQYNMAHKHASCIARVISKGCGVVTFNHRRQSTKNVLGIPYLAGIATGFVSCNLDLFCCHRRHSYVSCMHIADRISSQLRSGAAIRLIGLRVLHGKKIKLDESIGDILRLVILKNFPKL